MKIGSVEISGFSVLAPLAGITDMPFRLICKELGASLVYTEMISAEGNPFSLGQMDELMTLAGSGVDQLVALQRELLGDVTTAW